MSKEAPFGRDDQFDDYEIGAGYSDGKSSKDIADEQSFPAVPNGKNDFFAKKIELKTDPEKNNKVIIKSSKVFVPSFEGGEADLERVLRHMDATVTWAMVENANMTVREYFRLLPNDGDEENAEIFATSATKAGGKTGLDYNRFRHMISGLGFDIEDGSLPEEALKLKNWRMWDDGSPRIVNLNIRDQMDPDSDFKKPKTAANGTPYKQVVMFSHTRSEDTLIRTGELDTPSSEVPESDEEAQEELENEAEETEDEVQDEGQEGEEGAEEGEEETEEEQEEQEEEEQEEEAPPPPPPAPKTAPKATAKTAPKVETAPKAAPKASASSKTAPKTATAPKAETAPKGSTKKPSGGLRF